MKHSLISGFRYLVLSFCGLAVNSPSKDFLEISIEINFPTEKMNGEFAVHID
jgi:hypothetical protein